MANPKKKHTPMRTRMRRASNFKLSITEPVYDANMKEYYLPHRVSPSGYYNGELVLPPKKKKNKGQEK